MDEAEIRSEIERRRKRAMDLMLRETVWSIYSSQFQYMDDYLKKEPDSILPEVKNSLRRSNGQSEFDFAGSHFGLRCVPGKIEKDGRGFDKTETTEMTLSLSVDGKSVFEFEMRKSVTYGEDMPYFSEYMGRVKAFIEGPWVDQAGELLQSMRTYKQEYWKKKNAPREAQRLKQDMKSFGLE
ncbi:MAG: hypothetical protein ACYCO5_11625 [Acidobacteriaceae bacterium]